MDIELSFCELRCKEVINIIDGRRLGRIIDMVVDARSGKVTGLLTPGCKKFLFRASEDIFIPWCDIEKIGDDVILVKLGIHDSHPGEHPRPSQSERCKRDCPHCGGKGCDRCRPGGGGCPHCGGKGCDRCRRDRFCDEAGRFAADWVYHRFRDGRCGFCGGRGCERCRPGGGGCPHCGGRGCDRCRPGGGGCPHCGGRGCERCRPGGGGCPHCGGRGCERCRPGGGNCPHCGGRGCERCRPGGRCIDCGEGQRKDIRVNNADEREYAEYYNRYDDRGSRSEDEDDNDEY